MPLIVDKGQGELQSIKSRQRTGRILADRRCFITSAQAAATEAAERTKAD